MQKRQLLAATALAALVATAAVSPVWQHADSPRQAQWAYAVGMSDEEALAYGVGSAIACGLIGGVGGVACGITAAL